jgi:hypothetical protein
VALSKRYEYQLLVRHVGDHWPPDADELLIQMEGHSIILGASSRAITRRVLYGGRRLEDRSLPISADALRRIAAAPRVSIVAYGSVSPHSLSRLRDFVDEQVK